MKEFNENNKNEIQKSVFDKIEEMLPSSVGFIKAEFEGPDIVIYLKNAKSVYKDDTVIKDIAVEIKKKIIVRSDSASLMDPENALKKIKELVPEDAKLGSIKFLSEFSSVYIEALKPGLVIGKKGVTLRAIMYETGWIPKVLRIPTMESSTIEGVRNLVYNERDFRKKFLLNLGKQINQPALKSEWLKVTALGGYREVGRSSMLLETKNSKILIDCGISPEPGLKGAIANEDPEVNKAFPYLDAANFSIEELDAVVLTHAHMDHIGFVPYLYKYGYKGPVYCTPPTRDLAALLLNDYFRLVQKTGGTPLYDEKDIRNMLMHTIVREYGEVTNITNELKLTYHNAGHILGSSIVHLHVGEGEYNLVHTGDMKYGFTRLFDPADIKYPRMDALFIESTYGGNNDISINRKQAEINLMDIIKKTISNNGKVLIPLFAVGRSQEIQLVLNSYLKNYNIDAPVYMDGMILEASAIHTAYPEYLKESLKNMILNNKSPFESDIFEIIKGEREQVLERGPSIILASGGMLNGGTSLEYFKKLADDPKNSLIFVGYNSAGSLGRRLQNNLKEVPIMDENNKIIPLKINMNVFTVEGFSGHSDRRQLIDFVKDLRPRPSKIFTMHGEEQKCEDLADILRKITNADSRAPMNLDSIRLK
ncbi:MAG: beta-CASP ribonuclease aCPSF1 [Candidatus Marsarchaeota archaeon]|nr:beta-CASP ribonuclease aCPSF1 [Candidatus Marsarchaeota archaeon]MCL5094975.1 beta-CASP ribonuclease aCPSF1 [Candidatus Marsarchaeota archaeon]